MRSMSIGTKKCRDPLDEYRTLEGRWPWCVPLIGEGSGECNAGWKHHTACTGWSREVQPHERVSGDPPAQRTRHGYALALSYMYI